jgi:hypothetical protein
MQGDVCPIFPGTFDILLGRNENVSGGRLRGTVLRLDAQYPMPFAPYVHLYGTMMLRWKHNTFSKPFFFDAVTENQPDLTDPKVHILLNPPLDRDFYRLGIGLDIVHLINRPKK